MTTSQRAMHQSELSDHREGAVSMLQTAKKTNTAWFRAVRLLMVLAAGILVWSNGIALAQTPVISCPGVIELTLADIGNACIELPVAGEDSVTTEVGTWANDTLCLTPTTPEADTIRVIAFGPTGNDTCDVVISFPGATLKSGIINDETWLLAESPFCVVGDLRVGRLTIEAGVSVLFYGPFEMEIVNQLVAVGSESDSIKFLSASAQPWHGIFFDETPPGSELVRCVVSGSDSGAVRIDRADVLIDRCIFEDNTSSFGGGIRVTGVEKFSMFNSVVRNNSIANSIGQGGGVYVDADSAFLLNCTVTGNDITDLTYVYGAGIFSNGVLELRACLIIDNTMLAFSSDGRTHSYGGGVYSNGTLNATNCVIRSNSSRSNTTGFFGRSAESYGGGIFAVGNLNVRNSIVHNNVALAKQSSAINSITTRGGGLYASASGVRTVVNSSFASNTPQAAYAVTSTVSLLNSIIWENGTGAQLAGLTDVSYSCLQFGDTTGGNPNNLIIDNPAFLSADSLALFFGSPCIDAGDPAPEFNDLCFPPSLGASRNDMGAYGGPFACGWFPEPWILCPQEMITFCSGGSIVVPLRIFQADTVAINISGATWQNDSLFLGSLGTGSHPVTIVATNDFGAASCTFTVEIPQDSLPLVLAPDNLIFTQQGSVLSGPQVVQVELPCGADLIDWVLSKETSDSLGNDLSWLSLDKASGTTPDSVVVSITTDTLPEGIYTARLIFSDIDPSKRPDAIVNVTFFHGPGVSVGSQIVEPRKSVKIPIVIQTGDSLATFTLPLTFRRPDSAEGGLHYTIDSLSDLHPFVDSWRRVSDSSVVLEGLVEKPPLPDSESVVLAYIHVTSLGGFANGETISIVNDTIFENGGMDTVAYLFTTAAGVIDTLEFSEGALILLPELITDVDDDAEFRILPEAFELHPNYPNPFNPTTTIAFSLTKPAHVELVVFNILGRRLVTLIDEQYSAGRHSVRWDGKMSASGIYFYRLSAGNSAQVRKMILMK